MTLLKKVLITGGSGGIAQSIKALLEAEGYCVLAPSRLEMDVTDWNSIDKIMKEFAPDILINNAGISMRASFKEVDLSVIRRLMDVNFWGTIYCTKFALPYLLESKGSVTGVISVAGYAGLPGRTGYATSKFAIRAFLETLRMEHQEDGLHVMVFAPGYTESNVRNAALLADGTPQGSTPKDESSLMSAEEVARKLAYGLYRKKREMILTALGYWDVWFYKRFPRLMDWVQLNYIRKHEKGIDPIK